VIKAESFVTGRFYEVSWIFPETKGKRTIDPKVGDASSQNRDLEDDTPLFP